jgi:hypothetical protein
MNSQFQPGSAVTCLEKIPESVAAKLESVVRAFLNFENSHITKFCYRSRHYKTQFSLKTKFKYGPENGISKNAQSQEILKSPGIFKDQNQKTKIRNTLAPKDLPYAKDPKANSIKSPKIENPKFRKSAQERKRPRLLQQHR